MEIAELGLRDVSLMEGERIDSALNLSDGSGEVSAADRNMILLTDRRVIRLEQGWRRRKAAYVSLQDIDAVEVTRDRGYSPFVWGALALIVAVSIWQVWDHAVGSVVGPVVVVLMGAYLVADHWLSPGRLKAIFRAGSAQLSCGIGIDDTSSDVQSFVNRLFQVKAEEAEDPRPTRVFAPR